LVISLDVKSQKWLKTRLFKLIFLPLLSSMLSTQHGTRQAPECLDSVHISVRLREQLKAKKRHFYRCSPFAETGPRVLSTYIMLRQKKATVSIFRPLVVLLMTTVSTQYAVNLVGILVAYLGRSPIKSFLLEPVPT
jgi:BioD-like phosphotransacetylase family protein